MKETDDDPEGPGKTAPTSIDDAKHQESVDRFRAVAKSSPAGSIGEGDVADERLEKERRLDARIQELAVREAESLHEKAIDAEPAVTRDLNKVAQGAGGHLAGLEHRIKTQSSLCVKITDFPLDSYGLEDPERAIAEEGEQVNDALRYTVVATEDRYMTTRSDVREELQARGYSIERSANSWAPPDGSVAIPYRGINETWQTPKGYTFEVQFHTAASFEMKSLNHPLYKEAGDAHTSLLRAKELTGIMSGRFDRVPIPPGALDDSSTVGPTQEAAAMSDQDLVEGEERK
jgi:hypothetical protein